ncbi:MAG: hypothetical protein FE78DRAFT_84400 [Acidomyces sp. 'richmondensis']|nr:MAG: hypothetical protein FE78DRAFT_84400 [Acidomyces sp. 'richmondensis']
MAILNLTTVLLVLGIAVFLGFRWAVKQAQIDPREPPLISARIPFIGHLIGILWYGPKYYQIINTREYPIYTLPTLTTRNYIVSSPTLVSLVQRNTKSLSFYSVIVEVTRRMCAFDEDASKIIFYNMNKEHGPDNSLMTVVHDMMNKNLAPGPKLNELTLVQLQQMSLMLNNVGIEGAVSSNLYTWIQHVFTVCNSFAIYGAENIFAVHPELEKDFWDFEEGMLALVIDIYPWITARKAYLARKRVFNALTEYVKKERYKQASALIQERIAINRSFGLSCEMIGRGELVLYFGILGNAVPTAFWLLSNIYSRPQLLQQIRDELEDALRLNPQMIPPKVTVPEHIVKACPLLFSCYRETLRDVSNASSPRLVLSDTMLDKYLLKAGSIVQLQGGIMHQDKKVWGADAASWNPYRFIISDNTSDIGDPDDFKRVAAALPKGVPPSAFRSFGGGSTLCPGRHFAQSEIMTFIASMVLAFDLQAPCGATLKMPQKNDSSTRLALMMPVTQPQVVMKRRIGWETKQLEMTL